jgi:L-aminopeptidase/D-esterase-like protein
VATNAPLDRDALTAVARMAHDGIARAVSPAHTLFDGDTVFALAVGEEARRGAGGRPPDANLVGVFAAEAAAQAIRNAVLRATSLGGIPAARDLVPVSPPAADPPQGAR